MITENLVKNHQKFQPTSLPLLNLPNWMLVLAAVKMEQLLEYNHSKGFVIIQWPP